MTDAHRLALRGIEAWFTARRSLAVLCAVLAPLGAAAPSTNAPKTEFDARAKWFSSAVSLPGSDAVRHATGDATLIDHSADLRLMWRREVGSLKLIIAHTTTALGGDSTWRGAMSAATIEQTPTGDGNRFFDWTWSAASGTDARLLHRFDRLAVAYRTPRWGVTVGRQAVSWGAGLVFHPMDFLSPFAPTAIDQDYKAGDDLVHIERLFEGGADLQVLAVGRRGEDAVDNAASSVAAKFRSAAGGVELEVLTGRHRGEGVFGVGVRAPLGGALLRSDVVWARHEDGVVVSGVLNADYSVALAGTVVHVFAEYYRNGFGVRRLPAAGEALPALLAARLRRGEAFTRMRDYLAVGASFPWHFLVRQSVSLITNLHDGSRVLQAAVSFDASDAARLQAGFVKPFGGAGEEFGRVAAGARTTTGGGGQAFVRMVRYF